MSEKQPDALRLATILGNEFDTYTDTCSAKDEGKQHGPFWFALAIEKAHGIE